MIKNFDFYSPTKIFFGDNQENCIGDVIKNYGYRKVLLIYGKSSIKKIGLYECVCSCLKANNIEYYELSNIEPNPKIDKVRIGCQMARNYAIDLILAVGGGSVIDTAKAIACGRYLDFDPWLLNTHQVVPTKALPVGVILTISAAGSELSNSCVISNPDIKVKSGFNSDLIRPKFAILNPKLTFSVSPYQTACGIVDSLMHTLERFLTDVDDLYFEEEVAIGLMKSIVKSAYIVMNNPHDYNARAALMLASSFSHNGLTGLGGNFYFTVHKLEHELSGRYDFIHHAAGLSILYCGWAKCVFMYLPHKFAKFARDVFGINEVNDLKCAELGIYKMEEFFKMLKMPTTLAEVGVKASDIEIMANRITNFDTQTVPGFIELNRNLVVDILNKIK